MFVWKDLGDSGVVLNKGLSMLKSVRMKIQPVHLSVFIITAILVYVVGFKFMEVEIVPIVQANQNEPVFRGAMLDETWINADSIYKCGDWKFDAEKNIFRATSSEKLVLQLQVNEDYDLVFNGGPSEGNIVIRINGTEEVVSLYSNEILEYGKGIPITTTPSTLFWVAYASIACFAGILVTLFAQFMLKRIKKIYEKHERLLEGIWYVILVLVAGGFIYYFSISSSPKAKGFWGYDAAIFQVVGRGWAKGYLPYRDIFDHKGPFIFLIYMISNLIDEDMGIFLLSEFALGLSLVFAAKIGKCIAGKRGLVFCPLATILFLPIFMDEGALTEDFCLPFLMYSMYILVKYMCQVETEKRYTHPPKWAVFYGITCAISLMTRVTNCIAIVCFVACISILLIMKKEYRNLIQNAGSFLLGAAIIVLPFAVYFGVNRAFSDFVWGTIGFNLQYVESPPVHNKEELITMARFLIPVILSVFFVFEHTKFAISAVLTSAIGITCLLYNTFLFPHYYIITLPYVALCVGFALCAVKNGQVAYRYRIPYQILTICIVAYLGKYAFINIKSRAQWIDNIENGAQFEYNQAIYQQATLIPENERNSVLAYNVQADWYLITGIVPAHNHFSNQDWRNGFSEDLRLSDENFFKNHAPKWLIVCNGIENKVIAEIVAKEYKEVSTIYQEGAGTLSLYRNMNIQGKR